MTESMSQHIRDRCLLVLLSVAGCLLIGCSEAVMLSQESEEGGVVTYLYKEDRGGPMGSPHRKDALKVMATKCPSGYNIVKDGQVQGYSSMSSVEGGEGEEVTRRWGVQFQCKTPGSGGNHMDK
jgi:hypothetical protein